MTAVSFFYIKDKRMMNLKILQYTCIVVMFMLAFFTAASSFLVQRRNRKFERSRMMIIAALTILMVHYMLQMAFSLREQGDDVGALANIIFYAPAVILLSCSQLNLQMPGEMSRQYVMAGITGYVLMLVSATAGWICRDSINVRATVLAVDAMNMAILVYFIWRPYKQLRRMRKKLESEMGNPVEAYNRTMRTGAGIIYIFVVLSPLFILFKPMLFIFGPLGLLAISLFVVCFNALGFNYNNVDEIMNEINDIGNEERNTPTKTALTEARTAQIEESIKKWRDERGYRNPELTLATLTREIRINRSDFTAYLTARYAKTFRVWLSDIRTEEAKRMMKDYPEYSNELVSMECGFSSRVYFQRMFKEKTGMTPSEWKRSFKGKKHTDNV